MNYDDYIPMNLVNYQFIQELQKWNLDSTSRAVAERRSWTLSSIDYKYIRCTLNWRFGDGQMAGYCYTAMTAQEAVWRCLMQFFAWEIDYYKSRN